MKFWKFTECALIFALIFLFVLTAFPASAEEKSHCIDSACLISSEQEQTLNSVLAEYCENSNFDIVIVTTNDRGARSIKSYADSYYDDHGYRLNGILLVIDMSDRSYYESTSGYARNIWVSDYDFEALERKFTGYLKSGDYYTAFTGFISEVQKERDDYVSSPSFDEREVNMEYSEAELFWLRLRAILPSSLIIAVISALVITLIMTYSEKKKLTSVRFQRNAGMYLRRDSFCLTKERDIFLYRTESRVKINNSSNSGGPRGGGGHGGGGGGGSHGGHGGHF